MITPDVISYIRIERAKNTPDSTIKSNLLANGWTEQDYAEAMAALANPALSQVPNRTATDAITKAYRNKVLWSTFFVLLVIDILLIGFFKIFYGTYGAFGLSPLSIILRILFILLVASLAARRSSIHDSQPKAVAKGVMNVIGSIIITIVVVFGIFFAGCLFLVMSGGLRGL